MMQFQPVNYQPPNIIGNMLAAKQQKTQDDLNALRLESAKMDLDRQRQGNALMDAYANAQDNPDVTNADGTVTKGATKAEVQKSVMDRLIATNPDQASKVLGALKTMDDTQQQAYLRRADNLGRMAFAAKQNPQAFPQMFQGLDPETQKQIISQFGYNPQNPDLAVISKIADYGIAMSQDAKTLGEQAFKTSERKASEEFTAGENKANRQNQKDIANIHAGATLGAAKIHANSAKYSADKAFDWHTAVQENKQPKDTHNYEAMAEKMYGYKWMNMTPDEKKKAVDDVRTSYGGKGGYNSNGGSGAMTRQSAISEIKSQYPSATDEQINAFLKQKGL